MAQAVRHEQQHRRPHEGECHGVGLGEFLPVHEHTQQQLQRGVHIHEYAGQGDAGFLDAAGKEHQRHGGHHAAERQQRQFRSGEGAIRRETGELGVDDEPQRQRQHGEGLHADGHLALGLYPLFQRPVQGKAQPDDHRQIRHAAVQHHGVHHPDKGQRHGHPLHGAEPFLEDERSDDDGEQGVHVVGKAGLQNAAGGHREDVDAPVHGDEQAAAEVEPALLFIPQDGGHHLAVLFYKKHGQAEHAGKYDALRQHIGGVHAGQQLPEHRQQPPEDVAAQNLQRRSVHKVNLISKKYFAAGHSPSRRAAVSPRMPRTASSGSGRAARSSAFLPMSTLGQSVPNTNLCASRGRSGK